MADPCGYASARWTIQSETYSLGAIHAGRPVRTRDRPVGDPAARLLVAGPDLVPDRGRRAGPQRVAAALVQADRSCRAAPRDDRLLARPHLLPPPSLHPNPVSLHPRPPPLIPPA